MTSFIPVVASLSPLPSCACQQTKYQRQPYRIRNIAEHALPSPLVASIALGAAGLLLPRIVNFLKPHRESTHDDFEELFYDDEDFNSFARDGNDVDKPLRDVSHLMSDSDSGVHKDVAIAEPSLSPSALSSSPSQSAVPTHTPSTSSPGDEPARAPLKQSPSQGSRSSSGDLRRRPGRGQTRRRRTRKAAHVPSVNPDEFLQAKKAVIVLGPGGSGRTAVSSSLAYRFAENGTKSLLLSTSPMEVVSHVFGMSDSTSMISTPTVVPSVRNLSVLTPEAEAGGNLSLQSVSGPIGGGVAAAVQDILAVLPPGCDEMLAMMHFAGICEGVAPYDEFASFVLDGPPSRMGLRMLSMPDFVQRGLSQARRLKDSVSSSMSMLKQFLPSGNLPDLDRWDNEISLLTQKASGIAQVMRDPSRVSVLVVTENDPFRIREAVSLLKSLRNSGYSIGGVVLNDRRASTLSDGTSSARSDPTAHEPLTASRWSTHDGNASAGAVAGAVAGAGAGAGLDGEGNTLGQPCKDKPPSPPSLPSLSPPTSPPPPQHTSSSVPPPSPSVPSSSTTSYSSIMSSSSSPTSSSSLPLPAQPPSAVSLVSPLTTPRMAIGNRLASPEDIAVLEEAAGVPVTHIPYVSCDGEFEFLRELSIHIPL